MGDLETKWKMPFAILFGVIEIILLLVLIYFLIKVHKNRNCYPIKQLSPIITILQGLSFYMFQLAITCNFYYSLFFHVPTQDDCKNENQTFQNQENLINYNKTLYYIIIFIYLTSRGCCYTLTLMKSYRILNAFSYEILDINNILTKICSGEVSLILIAFFYAILFPVFTVCTTIFIKRFDLMCCLQVYENNTGILFFNSLAEEIFTLLLAKKINYNYYNDNLINLTIKLQLYYIIWFALNSVIFKLYDFGSYVVELSCWIRCFYMFYNFTCIPLKEIQEHPNIYITFDQVQNFQLICLQSFNNFYKNNYSLVSFQNYLTKCNKAHSIPPELDWIQELNQFTDDQLFKKYLEAVQLQKYHGNMFTLQEKLIKLFDLQIQSINLSNSINRNYPLNTLINDLENYFKSIYTDHFQRTFAFQKIKKLTQYNQTIQKNFNTLKVPLNEWSMQNIL